MPTTYQVFALGQLPDWDTAEGGTNVSTGRVNQSLGTYGSAADPLFENIVTWTPAGAGFNGGTSDAFDMNNDVSNDQFSIDGGPAATFDSSMIFNAVITYTDGTTANITAVLAQDTNGNTYWMPERANNGAASAADQVAIEAGVIRSLELVSPVYNGRGGAAYNLAADRVDSMPLCFTPGMLIACPDGLRPVEDLTPGDLVMTHDHGAQPLRWVGRRTVAATGNFTPVRIAAGTFGATADFEVSPQHCILLQGPDVDLHFGTPQVLSAAKHLVDGHNIRFRSGGTVDYIHLLCDTHEIVTANGVATETLFLGARAQSALSAQHFAEVATIFPELADVTVSVHKTARRVLRSFEARLLRTPARRLRAVA